MSTPRPEVMPRYDTGLAQNKKIRLRKSDLTKDCNVCYFSLATRITSQTSEDTFIGQPETYNFDETRWELVVAANWTMDDANAVCRETGHGDALEHIPGDIFDEIKEINQTLFPENKYKKRWEKSCTDSDYSIWLCRNKSKREDSKETENGVGVRCRVAGMKVFQNVLVYCNTREETY